MNAPITDGGLEILKEQHLHDLLRLGEQVARESFFFGEAPLLGFFRRLGAVKLAETRFPIGIECDILDCFSRRRQRFRPGRGRFRGGGVGGSIGGWTYSGHGI